MTTSPVIQEIQLARVDLDTHPFRIARNEDTTRLQESMAAVGLVSCPRVQPHTQGRWRPITGWRRLAAAARLGWKKLPAVILGPEIPEAHLLLLYLHDNAFTRSFNPLEQARLAFRLLGHWDRETLVAKGLPLLGLPPASAYLERLLAVAELEPPWQELVENGRVALTAAAHLAAWDPGDRRAALPFLANLPLSQSKQEEFVASVETLAHREGLHRAAILHRGELQEDLQDAAATPQARAEAVRRRLKAWVSPRYEAAQKAFGAGLNRLGLAHHPRLHLKEPPAFEGPDFELLVKFKDSHEMGELLQELARLLDGEEFKALIDLI